MQIRILKMRNIFFLIVLASVYVMGEFLNIPYPETTSPSNPFTDGEKNRIHDLLDRIEKKLKQGETVIKNDGKPLHEKMRQHEETLDEFLEKIHKSSKKIVEAPVCKKDEYLVQNFHKYQSNGCTKPAYFAVEGDEDFTHCCDIHDSCYETCGISRDYCEEIFHECLMTLCNDVFSHNSKCISAADAYVLGTDSASPIGVEAHFNEIQAFYCECIKKPYVVARYRRLFEQFYTEHYPQRMDSHFFKRFVKYEANTGTEDNPKYELLPLAYLNLHLEYDHAIQHVGDRKGHVPPRPDKEQVEKSHEDL